MRSRLSLLGMVAALFTVSSLGLAQVPERRLPPPDAKPGVVNPPQTGSMDPGGTLVPITETSGPGTETVDPKTGTRDPTIAAPPAVAPGTVQQQPAARPSRELVYLAPGEPPANLQVTATGPRSVTLSWSAPAGASGYWVHQAGAGQTEYYSSGSLVTETTATVTGLLPATPYSFKVNAVYPQELQRRAGMSEAASATTAAAPAPTGLTASVVGRGKVNLSWDKLPGADGFRLFRNGAVLSDIKPITVAQGLPAATSFPDSVPPGTHLYQIQAVYRASSTGKGAEAVSALAPTPPVGVTFKAFRFCQTMVGAASCAEPGAPSVTIAATAAARPAGRKSP